MPSGARLEGASDTLFGYAFGSNSVNEADTMSFAVTRYLVLRYVALVVNNFHAKCSTLFELSCRAVLSLLFGLSIPVFCLIRLLQYLAIVLAGPTRLLRAVMAVEYVPAHAIIMVVLFYRLRVPLARYLKVAPIGMSNP